MKKNIISKRIFFKEIHALINHIKKKYKKKYIYLHEPFFDKREIQNLSECINSTYVSTNGNWIKKFENQIKKITKSKYVITTNNGTSAIHSGLIYFGINSKHEVLIPNINFIAAPNAVKYCGGVPVLIDIDTEDLGPDVKKLEEFLREKYYIKNNICINRKNKKILKALIVTHVFGMPAKINEIINLAKKYKFIVLEDATEALGSKYRNKHLGTYGKIGFLSFNGNKIITTGGGGAILTNSFKIYKKIKHLSSTARIQDKIELTYSNVGYNYRMPNINAALGCAQIIKLKEYLKQKRENHKSYKILFSKFHCFELMDEKRDSTNNFWLETVIIKKEYIKYRKLMFEIFFKNNIFIRPVWKCISNQNAFKNCKKMNLKNSINLEKRIFNLPSSYIE